MIVHVCSKPKYHYLWASAFGLRFDRRYRDRDDRWRYRNAYNYGYRTTTETRLVQRGWHTYRETYQVTYFPNGQVQTSLISRFRVS